MSPSSIPDILALVDPLLGLPYAQYDCWQLVRKLYLEGWGIDFEADPAAAIHQVQEIWFEDEDGDPLALVQPWDLVIFRTRAMASGHVGIMVDERQFVHERRTGLCLEPLVRWRARLMQIARLRRLL